MTTERVHDVVVIGGGNAGVSLAARLRRDGCRDVAVVEPARVHVYRPLLSYVGGGQAPMAETERPQQWVMDRAGATWYPDRAVAVDPVARSVTLSDGTHLRGTDLVLCPGVEPDWESIPGSRAAVGAPTGATNYVDDRASHTWELVRSTRRGRAVFVVGDGPVPCAGAALKPLFLAADHWRREGVLEDIEVTLLVPWPTIFGPARVDHELEHATRRLGITVRTGARVRSVDAEASTISWTDADGEHETGYDALHLVPGHRAPAWIAWDGLADDDSAGMIAVSPTTLAHRHHARIWGLGDAADVRASRSGGALRQQVPVLAENLQRARTGRPLVAYDGYSTHPITTSQRTLVLAEIDRDGELVATLPGIDLVRERRSTWLYDRYLQPQLYWRGILRGRVSR